ncbi:MAG: hypothetical protein D3910_04865 [Candidatus Electrothrix sp. ATG2]|nr:hypothetical protein [Candidatus Electrothrix sp. ATG2]
MCFKAKIAWVFFNALSQPIKMEETDEDCKGEECIKDVSDHAKGRRDEAKAGDADREVGDPNRVVQDGSEYTDSETGNTVHVKGNKIVVTDGNGRQITQFKNTRRNTNNRIRSGRWIPK